ncbi:MAG: Coenzyme F420:L-glutamate ligase [Candidatus Poseidoniaceae archaeon]|nr:MAG: Coenzyme F420:L-glutamate ligase [Candidatus Poseidoniaceae archaeon]
MEDQLFVPLSWTEVTLEEMHLRSRELLEVMRRRRTTRHFSTRSVPKELIESAILCGGTAPSGAHLQPWTFVAISSKELKQKIREAAEVEERKTYQDRMPDAWREVLQPLGTDAVKEHLTDAPWVVVLFRQSKRLRSNGEWGPTYYSSESCGIAAGMFIHAVHKMGLVTLTHTPSPMGFLRDILNRPDHEHAMLVLPVGYPADDAQVPDLERKSLDEISVFFEA